MSTNWWNVWSHIVFANKGSEIMRDFNDESWRETHAVTELTHNLGLVQELMYASPDLTTDLIRTRQFEPILHRLKPELDSIRQWMIPTSGLYPPDESGAAGLRNILLRLEIDYIRLYANSISMRAAHHRLAPRLRSPNTHRRFFESSVLRWAEAPFILEAVEAAINLMRAGIDLHKRGVLQYCHGRTFLRMVRQPPSPLTADVRVRVPHEGDELRCRCSGRGRHGQSPVRPYRYAARCRGR
jgi:hypothetical protein